MTLKKQHITQCALIQCEDADCESQKNLRRHAIRRSLKYKNAESILIEQWLYEFASRDFCPL